MDILSKFMGLDLICEYLIKSSLILTFAFFLAFILRKKSASIRHFILSLSLISLMLIPFLSSVSSGWETKLIPGWNKQKVDSPITNRWIHSSIFFPQDPEKTFIPDEKKSSPSEGIISTAERNGSFTVDLNEKKNSLSLIFPFLWILGLLFLLIKIGVGLNGASRITRSGERITGPPFQQILQQLCKVISLKRKVGLLSNRQILTPITWGVIRPVVILPEASRKWTKSQGLSVLFHELSHIKRGDFLVKIIARFICSIFWFNPIIWITYNSMKKEQEKACDELVLNSGIKPSTYAANLLSIKQVKQSKWTPPTPVLGAFNRSQLNDRLIAILKKQIMPKEIKMKNKILFTLIFILVITVIGLAHPVKSAKMKGDTVLTGEPSISTAQFTKSQQDVQEIRENEQEKKETEEKLKEQESQSEKEKKKGIKWIVKDGDSGVAAFYIADAGHVQYIIDSNEVIEIKLDGKIILVDKDGEKKAFSIITDGEECVLKKDEYGNWKIDGKKLEVLNEDGIKIIKLGEIKDVVIKKEDGSWTIKADKMELTKDGKLKVLALDDNNKILIQSKDSDFEDEIIKILVPKLLIKTDKSGHKNLAIYLGDDEDELEDIVISPSSDHTVWLYTGTDELKALGEICMIGYIKGDEGFKIIFQSDELDETQREEYTEIFEKIKNKLKGRYDVESEINDEDNTFILKIKSEKLDKPQKIEMKKLLNEIVDVIKEVREPKKVK